MFLRDANPEKWSGLLPCFGCLFFLDPPSLEVFSQAKMMDVNISLG